jgi:hypothetical protein
MVEDERHPAPAPLLALPTQLASALLEPFGVQALLELAARVGRVFDEGLGKRAGPAPALETSL